MPRLYSKPTISTDRRKHTVGRGYVSNDSNGTFFGIKMGRSTPLPGLRSGGTQTVYTKPFKALEEPLAAVDEYGHTEAQVNEMDKHVYGIFTPFVQWLRGIIDTVTKAVPIPVDKIMSGLTDLATELFPGVKEIGEGAMSGNAGLILKGLATGLLAEFGPTLFLKAMRQGRLVMIAGRRFFRTGGKLLAQGPRGVWKTLVEAVPAKPRFIANYFGKKNAASVIQRGFRGSKGGRRFASVMDDIRAARSAARNESKLADFMNYKKNRSLTKSFDSFKDNLYSRRRYPRRMPFRSGVHYDGDIYW